MQIVVPGGQECFGLRVAAGSQAAASGALSNGIGVPEHLGRGVRRGAHGVRMAGA